ncbi:MAG: hypothetical protein WCF67_08390, partial [Chitinophagaceae bacterium]
MPKLFVIMPFGNKTLTETSDNIDFDVVYNELIQKAGIEVGWTVVRIDEMTVPGYISDQYLREIMVADLVLADISIPNPNVFYELGIRHAISSGGTILIARTGSSIPFDLSSHRIIFYPEDQSVWSRTIKLIADFLRTHTAVPVENPVRSFLEKIGTLSSPQNDSVAFEQDISARIQRSKNIEQLIAVWFWIKNLNPLPVSPLLTLAVRLSEYKEWLLASEVLKTAVKQREDDFEIYRQLGWFLQQIGPEHDEESLIAFERALSLNPFDPETLGMMGGRLKRQAKFAEALTFYDRGALVSPNSIYILVNQAALKILSQPESPDAGIELYKSLAGHILKTRFTSSDEWTELVLGECYFVLGQMELAKQYYSNSVKIATTPNSLYSAAKQLEVFEGVGFR